MRTFLVLIIALFLSGLLFWFGWSRQAQAWESRNWPETAGRVVHSKVEEHTRRKSGQIKRLYSADIRYEYSVSGQGYQGKNITWMDGRTGSRGPAESRASQYSVGTPVTVYYNPDNPKEACLVRTAGWAPWLMMGGGAVIFLGMLSSVIFGTLRVRP